ncbi:MAG: SH3 domain-containing protein [Devosia sp.]
MNRTHEKLLVAALAGLVIASAAAFAIQPAMAAGYDVDAPAQVTGVKSWDVLNVRKWPASYSRKVGELEPKVHVWVERCIVAETGGADWCLVERGDEYGWVNSKFLTLSYDNDI